MNAADAIPTRSDSSPRIPGDPGAWALIFTEMAIFGFLFFAFLVEKAWDRPLFEHSRALLDPAIGFANTALLLISSCIVYYGVDRYRAGQEKAGRIALFATILCATLFIGIKVTEYGGKLHSGLTPQTNIFFSYYYALTGLHLVHVVAGATMLWFALRQSSVRARGARIRFVEFAGCFWHMVDLLWIVIFPLLYLS